MRTWRRTTTHTRDRSIDPPDPGIVYRGSGQNRPAALAAGPDVRVIVARLQELEGSEEERIAMLA